ncbi:hypothetical protein [Mucilaginibacter puniceus]
MSRLVLFLLLFIVAANTAMAQKWPQGYFYDTKGNKVTGFINQYPRGKAPMKDEGFIEFKEDAKAPTIKLSASDLKSYVVGRDSFIVAATDRWSEKILDFVRVALDTDLKLFAAFGNVGGSSKGGFSPQIGIGTGIGGGSYGGGFGGGVSGGIGIPIGGSGRAASTEVYFFGTTTAGMKPISNQAFIDIMVEVMGDEPEVVEQIRAKKFSLGTIEKLIAYYRSVEAFHKSESR